MDFQEYMLAINATTLSSPEDKLTWVFNVFDGDGGGTIDANEINTMMVGLFEMAGAKVNEEQLAVREGCEKKNRKKSGLLPNWGGEGLGW